MDKMDQKSRHSGESRNPKFKTWTPAFAGATALVLSLLPSHLLFAEATKEFFTDRGLYTGNPPGIRQDLFSWGPGVFNATFTDTSAAEGRQSALLQTRTWGGWGIGNFIGQQVTGVPYPDYATGSIRFWLKSNTTLRLEIEHSGGAKSRRPPPGDLIPSTDNQWVEIVYPLSEFTFPVPVNFNQIRAPFLLGDAGDPGQKTWYVDHIRWTKPLASIVLFPSDTRVPVNGRRQFTAEGRSGPAGAGEHVIVYPQFTTTSGTIFPPAPARTRSAVLAASNSDGIILATAGQGTPGQATFTIAADTQNPFGLLSETFSGVNLDADSKLLSFEGAGGRVIEILDDFTDLREGEKSLKALVNSTSTTGFAGWFVQWGTTNTNDTHTRDMSAFYEGSIRFWLKAPRSLDGKLFVGIRSGNVLEGSELSKMPVPIANDDWNPVTVRISDFARPPPWADLSRTKVLFSIFVVGQTGGQQAFSVDNLRWDRRYPGPLVALSIEPSPATLPLGARCMFVARGRDANQVPIDVWPTWSMPGNVIGTLSRTRGDSVFLTALNTPVTGPLRAQEGPVLSTTSLVTVANVPLNRFFNVFSDAGVGGFVGVSTGGANATQIVLSTESGGAPEGATYLRATYTLENNPSQQDAYALWFTEEPQGDAFMRFYQEGYLHFYVRTTRDLAIAIRSSNITPGQEPLFRLSELGVPLNGTWQRVILCLNDFKSRRPDLDFDRIKTYFVIGAFSRYGGPAANATFDVDDVRWVTTSTELPEEAKVYQGLVNKQRPSGLIESFDGHPNPRAVTYDQSLAAMCYTFRKDFARSQGIFNVYQTLYNQGTFEGFADDYHMDTIAVLDEDRLLGPNTWMLLALMHYRIVSGDNRYDDMMDGLADWILGFQDGDGGMKFGNPREFGQRNIKPTEFNVNCYAAFRTYSQLRGNPSYDQAADRIANWLETRVWNSTEQRFNVGVHANGQINPDKALDVYSWPILSLSSYTAALNTVDRDFRVTHINELTLVPVDGYDFSAFQNVPNPDKDAVWLEGTAQMVLAYLAAGDQNKATYFLRQIERAVVNISPMAQGITYATNRGTAYPDWYMDSRYPSASSPAWYLFALHNFNPYHPFGTRRITVKNISDNQAANDLSWPSVVLPARWVRSNQYIEVDVQPNSIDPWGLQIYTHNTHPSANPRFVDPTPLNTINLDSNPAGLVQVIPAQSTSPITIPMAWSIKDTTGTVPNAFDPRLSCPGFEGPDEAYQWHFFQDLATPAIDLDGNGSVGDECDGVAFTPGDPSVVTRNASGIHIAQGAANFAAALQPDHIYIEADFTGGAAQSTYRGTIVLEYFVE